MDSQVRSQLRSAATMLAGAAIGLATAVIAGLALVPRVRLVEVITVIAGGIGAGAALVGALIQFKQARAASRNRS